MVRIKNKTKNAFPPSFLTGSISHCSYFTLLIFHTELLFSWCFYLLPLSGIWGSACNTLDLPLHLPYISSPAPAMGFIMRVTVFRELLLHIGSSSSKTAPAWPLSPECTPPEMHCCSRDLPWAAAPVSICLCIVSTQFAAAFSVPPPAVTQGPSQASRWISALLWTYRRHSSCKGSTA